jgi:hypothetical protein
MMPGTKKPKTQWENPYYIITCENVWTLIHENNPLIYCAIEDGESWKILYRPEGGGSYITLVFAVLHEHRADLLTLIIERHAVEKDSIFSRPVVRDIFHNAEYGAAWRVFNRVTHKHCGLSAEEKEDLEYQMFSLMFECGGCPIDKLVNMSWGLYATSKNKIYQRLVCELGKRQASWAIAWWSKQVGESWTDMVVPLNNIFDAATFEDYWG